MTTKEALEALKEELWSVKADPVPPGYKSISEMSKESGLARSTIKDRLSDAVEVGLVDVVSIRQRTGGVVKYYKIKSKKRIK